MSDRGTLKVFMADHNSVDGHEKDRLVSLGWL